MKMSNYPRGEWQQIWDGLFWRFMHVHRGYLTNNPRLTMLIKNFDKRPEDIKKAIAQLANNFLHKFEESLQTNF